MARPSSSLSPMDRLIECLCRLPGIGRRSAQRMAFHLLKQSREEARQLASAICDLKDQSQQCSVCSNLAESDPCAICSDPRRDATVVLVVEQPNDVAILESTGLFRGRYHVLMGRLAPLDGVGPGELNIESLIERVGRDQVREVILGTNPTLEGDGTAMYLAEQLRRMGVKVSRLARGLPTGASLEMASKAVLADALEGRRAMDSGG